MNIVGIDIGGTFTDLVGYVDGKIVTSKTSTVPADPTQGIARSLELANCDPNTLNEILHGSTIAINTVLERKGARTALITTAGFRDVYAIGRSNRIQAFNLFFKRPQPLVPRSLTFEIPERILASGEVLEALDEKALAGIISEIEAGGVESVAVCLLHSWANPSHERRVGEILRRALPNVFVTLSHEILREYREYERSSTTALNAFVGPRVEGYLKRLETYLRSGAFGGKIHIMRSNGGVMSIGQAQEQPVSMMESGPVAGMIGAGRLAKMLGLKRCIGFDMGGTTAKSSLITDGAPAIETGYVIGEEADGQPMQLPVVNIVEVGAGGGSIAWVDNAGGLHVGPQSVGADPGPACYGKGADLPVVTDADLILGRINPQRFLNGGMPLDKAASERAMMNKVGTQLGLNAVEAALGVAKIADTSMSLSVRAVSIHKGIDPRDTAMIAFGGAGPLHAIAIAREIYIPQVIIPKLPGTFSALGMLMASWRQDFVQTFIGRVGELTEEAVNKVYQELVASAREQMKRDGISETEADYRFFADLRYAGQEHAISIPIESTAQLFGDTGEVRKRFDAEHDRRYSQSAPTEALEVVSLRLVLTAARTDNVAEEWLSRPWEPEAEAEVGSRDVVFDDASKPLKTAIYWRPALPAGFKLTGPAVIEEPNSTILIHPGDEVVVHEAGHLLVTLAKQSEE
ncbi:hydantoinase/oxoprolinase family protein [Neorhizobium sp. CSC1952]|uniref:hydantoinase/oxoprolinase family protein n=1 Tax=Neorhizobium sp. CSC1952 TaxID=2978974 RepID=UPI0025A61745|nr:hydantoinase/oxoprolinase family protein [Rhizobium sp. CSC1952]WJR69119.1 hydantoinase/oxoprolinase family protein [Rhizobium sp. CSC1952]